MAIAINASFDSGNIIVKELGSDGSARLEIRRDHESDFFQWFHFRVTGGAGSALAMTIENAGEAAYVDGWEGYEAVASYDRENWFRVDTEYADGQLTIRHEPLLDSMYFAYFAPYSMERHLDLIAEACHSPLVAYEQIGETLDGQAMDLLRIGIPETGKKVIWTIARQHPGESMAEWWMEGFINRLVDEDDPSARVLLDKAVVYVVPNMNPDGSRRGHLRTNACGANLNREWIGASAERSPEVLCVREKMQATGVDFSLDVHGDEALEHNFIAGAEAVERWSDRMATLQTKFQAALVAASPDFQTEFGYDIDPPNSSDLKKSTEDVAQTFDCLAMTLEMPFKDTTDTAQPDTGWSPQRSKLLGAACVDAIRVIVDDLR